MSDLNIPTIGDVRLGQIATLIGLLDAQLIHGKEKATLAEWTAQKHWACLREFLIEDYFLRGENL